MIFVDVSTLRFDSSLRFFIIGIYWFVLWKLFPLYSFGSGRDSLSESILQIIPETMASSTTKILCDAGESDLCRDDSAAFLLKFVAIASILLAGAAGVAIPLIGRNRRFLQTEGNLL
ncbi:hypothetical protein AtNW77_Chr1g0011691 [Arabidopsis thaliana]